MSFWLVQASISFAIVASWCLLSIITFGTFFVGIFAIKSFILADNCSYWCFAYELCRHFRFFGYKFRRNLVSIVSESSHSRLQLINRVSDFAISSFTLLTYCHYAGVTWSNFAFRLCGLKRGSILIRISWSWSMFIIFAQTVVISSLSLSVSLFSIDAFNLAAKLRAISILYGSCPVCSWCLFQVLIPVHNRKILGSLAIVFMDTLLHIGIPFPRALSNPKIVVFKWLSTLLGEPHGWNSPVKTIAIPGLMEFSCRDPRSTRDKGYTNLNLIKRTYHRQKTQFLS